MHSTHHLLAGVFLGMWLGRSAVCADALAWQEQRSAAMQLAAAEAKLVLLVAGRPDS